MKFGIYYIPPTGDFYQRGSRLIGYDIRQAKPLDPPAWINPEWAADSRIYGFHLTLTDAVEISPEDLPAIDLRLVEMLRCFSPQGKRPLEFKQSPASFWSQQIAVLEMILSLPVAILHTALVCALQSQGKGSYYTDLLKTNPSIFSDSPCKIQKIRNFSAPYILDDFVPHFTLLNPYLGMNQSAILGQIEQWFDESLDPVEIQSVCLVIQEKKNNFYKIYKEYDFDSMRE